jgi:hypothetical protein
MAEKSRRSKAQMKSQYASERARILLYQAARLCVEIDDDEDGDWGNFVQPIFRMHRTLADLAEILDIKEGVDEIIKQYADLENR